MSSKVHIAIIYSLPTDQAKKRRFVVTDEDTKESAEEVYEALLSKGFSAELLPLTDITLDSIPNIHADCIFNLTEWDGLDLGLSVKAAKLLEERKKPFTGSDSRAIETTANKKLLKAALQALKLPTAPWMICETGDENIPENLAFPVIIKPSQEHCSIGLDTAAVVHKKADLAIIVKKKLKEFRMPLVVEEFIIGREFQVTVIENDGVVDVLPLAEIIFTSQNPEEFLTFESRWDETHPDYQKSRVTLPQPSKITEKISSITKKTFHSLGLHDYARLDIRSRGSDVFILEANANPGLGDDDDYGMTVSYKAAGMTFDDLIVGIVKSSFKRFGLTI